MIGDDTTEKQNLNESFLRNFKDTQQTFRIYNESLVLNLGYTAGPLRPVLLAQHHSLQERSSVWTLLQVGPGLSTPEHPNEIFIISTIGKTLLREPFHSNALADSVALKSATVVPKAGKPPPETAICISSHSVTLSLSRLGWKRTRIPK